MNQAERVAMVERGRAGLSVRRQYALLGLARSGIYRKPAAPDPGELALMRWLDEQYLATPFVACPGEGRGLAADDGGAAPDGPSDQPQAPATIDAADGPRSGGPKAQDQPSLSAAPDLSSPVTRAVAIRCQQGDPVAPDVLLRTVAIPGRSHPTGPDQRV